MQTFHMNFQILGYSNLDDKRNIKKKQQYKQNIKSARATETNECLYEASLTLSGCFGINGARLYVRLVDFHRHVACFVQKPKSFSKQSLTTMFNDGQPARKSCQISMAKLCSVSNICWRNFEQPFEKNTRYVVCMPVVMATQKKVLQPNSFWLIKYLWTNRIITSVVIIRFIVDVDLNTQKKNKIIGRTDGSDHRTRKILQLV